MAVPHKDTCPLCGQATLGLSNLAGTIGSQKIVADEAELLAILRSTTPRGERRQVYRSRGNTWHCTYTKDVVVDRRLITALVGSGVLHRVYDDTGDVFWLGPTLDVKATVTERRRTGRRDAMVYTTSKSHQRELQ